VHAPMENIRWKQRFMNYEKALIVLRNFTSVEKLNIREEQGLIKSFEYTYELGWNVMKDFLLEKGNNEIYGSKDSIRQAFKMGIIDNGEAWMDMVNDRNRTVHTYDHENAEIVVNNILKNHISAFENFYSKMKTYL
jgi:nucleotidyltransferase substrate binding protein (TIGR01987 family)